MLKYFRNFVLIVVLFNVTMAYGKNKLVSINLDTENYLELNFEKELSVDDIKIKTIENPNKKIYDFKDVLIGNNIGKIDAKRTVSIVPNGSSMDARVSIDGDVAGTGRLSDSGKLFRIKLKLNNKDAKSDKITEDDTIVGSSYHNSEVVVIDAGHGGKDPGAISDGTKEKDIVLSVAKKLGKSLSKKGYKVFLTRDSDKFLTLEQRTRIADNKNAKIFISLHCNAAPSREYYSSLHGIETYFLHKTRDARSQSVAARENASVLQDADKKSKRVILDSVLSGPKIVLSNKLAIDIQKEILNNTNAKNSGVKSAPFWVLVGASRPSILIELGYITNPNERSKLLSDEYQDQIVDGIADGISRYKKNRQSEIDN